jgi:hypothetical protein
MSGLAGAGSVFVSSFVFVLVGKFIAGQCAPANVTQRSGDSGKCVTSAAALAGRLSVGWLIGEWLAQNINVRLWLLA